MTRALEPGPHDVDSHAIDTIASRTVERILGRSIDRALYTTAGLRLYVDECGASLLDRTNLRRPSLDGLAAEDRRIIGIVEGHAEQIASARSPEGQAFEIQLFERTLARAVGEAPGSTSIERQEALNARRRFYGAGRTPYRFDLARRPVGRHDRPHRLVSISDLHIIAQPD